MFRAKKSQMIYIEGSSGEDLARQYNAAMDGLTRRLATVTDKMIDQAKLSAVILYEVVEQVPECLKDRYELEGIFPTCSECPHYVPGKYGLGECHRVKGQLRHDDAICKARWKEIESEIMERRDANAPQFSSGNGPARREPAAAR